MTVQRGLAAALVVAAFGPTAFGQELKLWKHGVIEPKGDAGFMLMVGQRDFASRFGLKLDIVSLKNGATAHKALLAGELDSIESSPGATILAGAHGADIKILGCDWPGVPHGLMVKSTVNKVEDLRGKTIANLSHGGFRDPEVRPIVEEVLAREFPGIKFIDYSEFGNFHGARAKELVAAMADKLRSLGCDAVISGIGA